MFRKRMWLGLAVMVLVQIAVSNLTALIGSDSIAVLAMQSVLTSFVAAFAGGMIARHGFVLPALAVWLVGWAAIGYILYKIAAPAVQAPLPSIFQHNWAVFLLTGMATGMAAYLGERFSGSGMGRVAAT